MHMPPADAAKALPELVAAIRRSKMLGKLTLQAVPGAEKVTRGMEQALARIEALGTTARDARSSRDAVAADLGRGARRAQARRTGGGRRRRADAVRHALRSAGAHQREKSQTGARPGAIGEFNRGASAASLPN